MSKYPTLRCMALLALSFNLEVALASEKVLLDLPSQVLPGALVIGRSDPGARVEVEGRAIRVAADGSFVFGVGRDTAAVVRVTASAPSGQRNEIAIPIQKRAFAIERVNGVPESTVNPNADIAARIAREQAEVNAARTRDDPRQDYRFGFQWPVTGRISGVYGSQRILNGTPKNPHYGLDIAARTGTVVQAPAAGLISYARNDLYLTGGTVILDHGHGLSSVFVHLSRVDVKLGQSIEPGDQIGLVGATGRASGPHLHWGMNWFDVRIDPQLLLGPMPKPR